MGHGRAGCPAGGQRAIIYTTGYLDTLVHVVIPAIYQRVSAFSHGRAVVEMATQRGIIDGRGRYLLPLQNDLLSGPDKSGFIRRVRVIDKEGSMQVRYLPPPGQPAIAPLFSEGEDFYQGRALVQQGTRAGLIDRAGHWVTPLAYQRLSLPRTLRSQPNIYGDQDEYDASADAEEWQNTATIRPRYPVPDTRYLVARRGGKIGVVARASGREVVPAVYDSILLNPLQGMASLRRAGRTYLVSLTTGRAVAGTYQGIDFQTVQGRRLYLTSTQPVAWALADTTSQLRTAWIPGTGYPTPEGWLLSHESQAWTLRSATGQLAFTSSGPIEQPEWDERWADVRQSSAES